MTTLEQSKRLIELGVRKESADRVWKWNKESLDYRPEKASKLEKPSIMPMITMKFYRLTIHRLSSVF